MIDSTDSAGHHVELSTFTCPFDDVRFLCVYYGPGPEDVREVPIPDVLAALFADDDIPPKL